jgi:hypothetical protein
MDRGGGIYRVAVPFGRKKANGLGGGHGVFIEAMTESADYPQDVNFSRSSEEDLQLDLAFNLKASRLFGIDGAGLVEDLSRGDQGWTRGPSGNGGRSCRYSVSETAAANLSACG